MICLNFAKKLILFTLSFLFLLFQPSFIPTVKAAPEAVAVPELSSDEPVTSASILSTSTQLNQTKFPDKGIPVLMYHSISTDPQNSLCVSEKDFNAQMEWLSSQNFHALTVDQLYNALATGASVPEKPILITFDDGYKDNYTAAWPILQKYGFVGTFFIITNAIVPSRIDWDQLKDLVKHGNSIGSHTVNHLDLRTMKDSQQESELANSKKILEEHLGVKVNSFCYPSGKYNQTTINLLQKLDYKIAFTTDTGRVHSGDDPLKLTRLRISGGMSLSSFKSLLQ